MQPTVHVIWHHVQSDRISDAKELVGVVLTGWEDANDVVNRLNEQDPDKRSWSRNGNYWKEEISVLDLKTI